MNMTLISSLINVFWVLVGVSITLYANRQISKNHSKKRRIAFIKPRVLKNDFENTHTIMTPQAKFAPSTGIRN